jgi:RNA polymerase sigma factor (sigma-70 family)
MELPGRGVVNDPLLTPRPVRRSDDVELSSRGPTAAAELKRSQTELYESRRIAMLRLGYLLTGSSSVAEELVHDGFEQVVRRWDAIHNPSAYLRLAVINGARSWGRRRRRTWNEPLEHHPAIDADAIAVRTALAALRHEEREALVLRYYVGLSDSQIAEAVDRPIGTVKSQIHRGLARMESALA